MRRNGLLLLLMIVFTVSTGASLIDRETKEGVLSLQNNLDKALEKILEETQTQNVEIEERLQRHQEMLEEALRRLEKLQSKPPVSTQIIREVPVVVSVPAPESQPIVAAEVAETMPLIETPPPTPSAEERASLEALQLKVNRAELFLHRTLGVSLFAILLLCLMLVVQKRGETKIKKLLWKSEVASLRGEVTRGRPHLKIQKEKNRVIMVNAGESVADDIRLSLGSAPGSLKQRQKCSPRMIAGEIIELPFDALTSGEVLYAHLEYRNPNTARIYKEQFTIKFDRLSGQVTTLSEVS